MSTVSKPRSYIKPGSPDSVVTVKPRYENFIGGRWVPPVNGARFATHRRNSAR